MTEPLPRPRPISVKEIEVLQRALRVAAVVPNIDALVGSVTQLQVVSRCSCGCDSVGFGLSSGDSSGYMAADALAVTPDGDPIGIIVWAIGNQVSELELYNYSEKLARLPVISSISSYGGETSEPAA